MKYVVFAVLLHAKTAYAGTQLDATRDPSVLFRPLAYTAEVNAANATAQVDVSATSRDSDFEFDLETAASASDRVLFKVGLSAEAERSHPGSVAWRPHVTARLSDAAERYYFSPRLHPLEGGRAVDLALETAIADLGLEVEVHSILEPNDWAASVEVTMDF